MNIPHTEVFKISVSQHTEGVALSRLERSWDGGEFTETDLNSIPKSVSDYLSLSTRSVGVTNQWIIAAEDYPLISDIANQCPQDFSNRDGRTLFQYLGNNEFSLSFFTTEFQPDLIPDHIPAIRTVADFCNYYRIEPLSDLLHSIDRHAEGYISGVELDFGEGGKVYSGNYDRKSVERIASEYPLKGIQYQSYVWGLQGDFDAPSGDYLYIPCTVEALKENIQNLNYACADALYEYKAVNNLLEDEDEEV